MSKPKIFVLDTNIILHDYKAIRKFKDNNIVIPIAVIEELDKFKKGNDALAFNARGFVREIDRLTEGKMFGKTGVPIGKNLGFIKIEPNHPFSPEYQDFFRDDIQDHRILATAMWVRDNNPGTFVALVTKDINLRMKAKAAGMEVQDYLTDKVEEEKVENAQKEVVTMELAPELLQALAYGQDTAIDWKSVQPDEPRANQLYKFSWKGSGKEEQVCARYDDTRGIIVLVNHFAALVRFDNIGVEIEIVFGKQNGDRLYDAFHRRLRGILALIGDRKAAVLIDTAADVPEFILHGDRVRQFGIMILLIGEEVSHEFHIFLRYTSGKQLFQYGEHFLLCEGAAAKQNFADGENLTVVHQGGLVSGENEALFLPIVNDLAAVAESLHISFVEESTNVVDVALHGAFVDAKAPGFIGFIDDLALA